MADERTFLLIGDFRDNITSHLEKINDTINTLKQNIGTFGSKRGGFNDLTKSMGKVIGAHVKLKEEVVGLRNEMRNSLPVLREYRREVGKAISANMHMAGGKRIVKKNNPYLNFLDQATRQTNELAKASRGVQLGRRMPRAPGGGGGGGGGGGRNYYGPTRTYTSGPRGSDYWDAPAAYGKKGASPYSKERWGVSRDETFAFGQTLGFTLGSALTGSIVQGFQIGVGLLTLPFQHLGDAMKERIADESTDVQTAGAMFAISERKNMKMFSNFNEAIRAQQAINYKLAESAAALPGATTEYVQTGKRVLDSMMTVLSKDVKGVSAFAAELGAKPGDQKDVLATLTQKFTEKAVLLGQGSTYKGAYGVPQLLEQLIGKEDVSENMFNKFAMYRDLPIFQSVFREMEGEIAKTGAYSADRIRLVFRLLDEALPNEVIQAHKNTMAGFLEATRSAFLDPEVGLFGMGRKIQGIQMAMVDQYGNFLDKQGNIVNSWDEAAKEQISLYESIQKILTGFGLPLSELASLLPQLFEPFSQLIKPLESTFRVAQSFYRNFNIYTKEFEALAKSFQDRGLTEAAGKMKRSAGARGSLLAIANLLTTFGDMTGGDFTKISKQLQDPNADLGGIAKSVMTSLFSSGFMEDLGFQIGLMIGGIVNTVAQMLGFATDTLGESKIIKGLKAGFDSVEGLKAVQYVIRNIFKILLQAIYEIFKLAPLEFSIIAAIGLILPAFTASISIMVANWLENSLDAAKISLGQRLNKDVLKPGFFGKARQAYLLDKAKAKTGFAPGGKGSGVKNAFATTASDLAKTAKKEDFIPLSKTKVATLSQDVAEMTSKILPEEIIRNKKFPNIALGVHKPVEIGGKFKAPSISKPATNTKGIPVSVKSVAQNALSKAKGFLGAAQTKLGAGGLTGLKNPIGMLGKFGSVLTVVTGALSGVATFLQTGDIFKALGATAGPIAGTIIGTAIAGPLGGFIGAWIGSQEWVTDTLGQAIQQISQNTTGAFQELGGLFTDLAAALNPLFGVSSELDKFHSLIVLLKIALTPVVAAFMLLEQAIRGLRMILKQAQIEFYEQGFFGLGKDAKKAQKLREELSALNKEAFAQLEKDKAWFQTYKEGDKAVLGGQNVSRKGGKWVNAKGQEVTSSSTAPSGSAPTMDSRNYTVGGVTYDWKTGKPVSGATPPATATSSAPAGSPAAIPQEVVQTAQSTMAINTKAGTQVTQGAAIQKSSEETKKNTTTANTTLNNIKAGLMAISNKLTGIQNAMLGDLNNIQAGVTSISSLLSSGSLKVKAEGMGPGNGPLGTAKGDLGRAQNMASQYGLSLTSWFRPGDKGYHGVGRAMDFSNGVSTPQQMEFAQAMVNQYGTSLKELIYTPLGFGIKDGTRVPLSYWGAATNAGHYDHVHVAFAEGYNKGRMFTSQADAASWENSMVPGSVKVASITGNSAEGFGSETNVVNNITINGVDKNGEQIAYEVADRIWKAMQDQRAASLFV